MPTFVERVRQRIRRATLHYRKESLIGKFRELPFSRAAILLGPPRAGTTIVSRCIGQHSRVQSIIEPYQLRREENYLQADPASLCADFGLTPDPDGCLLVKETFTRSENVDTAMQLLDNLSAPGGATTLIHVCRSPAAAFDSQVLASRTKWARDNAFTYNEDSLRDYLRSIVRNSLCTMFEPASGRRLLVFYERFCNQPEMELQRIMTALELPYESGQLALGGPSKISGGDPGARSSKQVEGVNDQRAAEKLRKELGHTEVGASVLELHGVVQRLSLQEVVQEEAVRQLRDVMQAISERHFPILYARFPGREPEQKAGA